MNLSKQQETLIGQFYKHLGQRFKTIDVASSDAPVSICAYDDEDKEYYVYLEDKLDKSIYGYDKTGIKIENTHFYNLYALISQEANVFWMSLFTDGYILWYLNDCCTPEQLKVTDEFTAIGVTSALHIEYDKKAETIPASPQLKNEYAFPTVTGSFNHFSMN